MKKIGRVQLLMVAAILLAASPVLTQSGRAGMLVPDDQLILGPPDWDYQMNVTPNTSPYDHRRMVVSEGCDVNGDGFEDILVGRRDFTHSGITHAGRAWLFLGSPSGLSDTPDLILNPPVGTTNYGFFGTAVACAGDVNHDGFADFMIGMDNYDELFSDEGAVFVYHGGAGIPDATADWYARGGNEFAHFGIAADGAGNVNGDNYDDIIIGAGEDYSFGGRDVYVWIGGPGGLGDPGTPANADWYASGPGSGSNFGGNVHGAGDLNGDSYGDVLVGAALYDGAVTNQGAVFIWLGSAAGLGAYGTTANADWIATSGQGPSYFGSGADGVGDLNDDGFDDLGVGAWAYDSPVVNEGKVFVWYGSDPLGPAGTPANADWTAELDTVNSYLGYAVHSAKDVTGDGYADLLATAPNFATGDGAISAAGAFFVWYGCEVGLGENGTLLNADIYGWSSQANSNLGRDEASAAFTHGDRLSDLFIVARDYDDPETNEGLVAGWYPIERLYIYLPVIIR